MSLLDVKIFTVIDRKLIYYSVKDACEPFAVGRRTFLTHHSNFHEIYTMKRNMPFRCQNGYNNLAALQNVYWEYTMKHQMQSHLHLKTYLQLSFLFLNNAHHCAFLVPWLLIFYHFQVFIYYCCWGFFCEVCMQWRTTISMYKNALFLSQRTFIIPGQVLKG